MTRRSGARQPSPRWRNATVLALALAAMVTGGCGPHHIHMPVPAAEMSPCTRIDCLRVVTWNLHAIPLLSPAVDARLSNVAAKIREQQPDVVLLQEIWARGYASRLARALADYRVTTASGCRHLWPCGGLAVLVRKGSGWIAAAPAFVPYDAYAPMCRVREWDGIANKGMLVIRLARGAESLVVVDTHLQSEYPE